MEFENFEALIERIEKDLGSDFNKNFREKRKKLAGLKNLPNQKIFSEFDQDKSEWVYNRGGKKEIQYHIYLRNNELGYGLGINSQRGSFNNDDPKEIANSIGNSFKELYSEITKILPKYAFKIGTKDQLGKMEEGEFVFFGNSIPYKNNNKLDDLKYQILLDDLKKQFEVYEKVFELNVSKRNENFLKAKEMEEIHKRIDLIKYKNQILYGPPGTGKTYHTINKAIAICNTSFNLNQERKLVKEEFDKLVKEGQIVFTTFHQSMSYEDFIEGIKPVMKGEEENEVGYEIQDGIFKIACANAAYHCYKAYKKDNKPTSTYSFDELYEAFIENIQSLMEAGTPPIFKTLTGKEITVIKITSTGSIKARAYNSVAKRNPAPLTKENLQKLYDKFETIDAIKNLKQVEETVEVTPRITEFYAVFKGLKAFEKEEFKPETDETTLDFITLEEKIRNFNERVYNRAIKEHGLNAEPVVLIIDEINRGNVSQIFGELITLIEDSKRLGNDEALEITLPYSKKKFGVPPNLYIIGTMNTADRSVEALDTALRRRFCFEEMMPDYEVLENKNIEGIELAELLKTINNRIEVLLDRDHTIGHSYFLNIHSLEDLKNTFKNNIIPLLQEYFYNDYGKIGLVLGKSFVRANAMTAKNDTSIFADFYTKNEIDIIKSYELIPFEAITDIKKACLDLLGKTTNTINELTNLEASVN